MFSIGITLFEQLDPSPRSIHYAGKNNHDNDNTRRVVQPCIVEWSLEVRECRIADLRMQKLRPAIDRMYEWPQVAVTSVCTLQLLTGIMLRSV